MTSEKATMKIMIGNITRKDILNIKREFNINDRRLDTNDVVSVEN